MCACGGGRPAAPHGRMSSLWPPSVCVVVHVHGLYADATGAGHAREVHARASEEACGQLLRLDVHRHRRVLVKKRARLDYDALARLQVSLEDVAVAVQQKKARLVARDEAIHEHALPTKEDVAKALDADVGVRDVVRGEEECVLAHIQFDSGMQRHDDQFARGVAREGDATGAVCGADDEGHARERALDAALKGHHAHRRSVVFPEHDVVLEEDRVAGREVYLGDGDDLALDLTGARAEVNLRHVLYARGLAPARFAYEVLDVERRAARAARERRALVHRLTPLAAYALKRAGVCGRSGGARRLRGRRGGRGRGRRGARGPWARGGGGAAP